MTCLGFRISCLEFTPDGPLDSYYPAKGGGTIARLTPCEPYDADGGLL